MEEQFGPKQDEHSLWDHLVTFVTGRPLRVLNNPPREKLKVNKGAATVLVTFKDGTSTSQRFEGYIRQEDWGGGCKPKWQATGQSLARDFIEGSGTILGWAGRDYPRHEVAYYTVTAVEDHWVEVP